MKLIEIVGARPQFIKLVPISRAITQHNEAIGSSLSTHNSKLLSEAIIHTGQHYDYEMSKVFFDQLGIKEPEYHLGVGSGTHGQQTGKMLEKIEEVLIKEIPDWVLVYGDTNSTLAGALAAAKLHIPVAHVEAGLRSYNRRMPEEINRVLTDHVSDFLFCPTETAVKNLKKEGFTNIVNNGHLISLNSSPHSTSYKPPTNHHRLQATNHQPVVVNVGDVMYDSVLYNVQLAEKRSTILEQLHLEPNEPNEPHEPSKPKSYALATVHRAENTDDPKRLVSIFSALDQLAQEGLKVILPLHPRTRKALANVSRGDELVRNFEVIDPAPYKDMLMLEKNAQVILTDSGGVQKEAFFFKVPCVTLREGTEWVETVEAGWNHLVGWESARIIKAVNEAKPGPDRVDFYGDGQAAERIVQLMVQFSLRTKAVQ